LHVTQVGNALIAGLLAAQIVLSASSAWGAWPELMTVARHPVWRVESLGAIQHEDAHWFVMEFWDGDAQTGHVFVRRHTATEGLSLATNIGDDPAGFDRLVTPGVRAAPSIAVDADAGVLISMKRNEPGYDTTIEESVVDPQQLQLVLNPPNLIDDENLRLGPRGNSWIAVNDILGDVWSCWTYHTETDDDDLYCRGRRTGAAGLTWTEGILPLATAPQSIEDHPSVVIQTAIGRRVVAYHSAAVGVKVRLFDLANNEDLPNNVALGGVRQVNFPHIAVDANDVLHVVAVDVARNRILYATCSINCHRNANWSRELIDDIGVAGDRMSSPQVAVDVAGHVYVAFQHTPAGQPDRSERVKVTAKCASGGWDNDGGELIDDSRGREQIGGHMLSKAVPAFGIDRFTNMLSVAYVQDIGLVDRVGRWARKDATLAYDDICAGQ
jgi:hypothetical protein